MIHGLLVMQRKSWPGRPKQTGKVGQIEKNTKSKESSDNNEQETLWSKAANATERPINTKTVPKINSSRRRQSKQHYSITSRTCR